MAWLGGRESCLGMFKRQTFPLTFFLGFFWSVGLALLFYLYVYVLPFLENHPKWKITFKIEVCYKILQIALKMRDSDDDQLKKL